MKWEESYQKMLSEILEHPKFGGMNPVDIGIECGYSENEVKKMLDCAKETKEELEPEIVYFILKDSKGIDVLMSVDTNSFEVKKNRELTMENNKVKNHILVSYGKDEDDFIDDFGDDEIWDEDEDNDENRCIIIKWENLKTGQTEEMWYDMEEIGGEISDAWIVKSGIVIYSSVGSAYLVPFDGRLSERIDMEEPELILEDDSSIYSVNSSEILKIDGDFTWIFPKNFEVSEIAGDDDIEAVEVENGKFYYYTNDYRVCGENYAREKITWKNQKKSSIQTILVTDNYKLSGHGILKEKNGVSSDVLSWLGGRNNTYGIWMSGIYGTKEEVGRDFVVLPSKDIILGVTNKNEIVRVNLNDNLVETIYKLR